MLAPIALLVSSLFATAHASIYVTNPVQSTVCTGGQSCQVQWVDNGESPLLSSLGTCDVALYTGEFVLAQALNPIDVSASSSFSFAPNPSAGPDGQYYIVFSNQALNYYGYSASFTLSGMTGTTPGGNGSSATPASTAASTPTSNTTAGATGASSAPSTETTTGANTTTATSPVTTNTLATTVTTASPVVTTSGSTTLTVTPTTSFSTAVTTTSTPSPTTTGAALRTGSSGSLAAALFLACAGALVF
ncbi:hypothetical protein EDD15DRAFT_791774 [Pisolithus albus]|nr:hypothetical protein EDD15DRAFT_791774 [Pisolithus albus]